MDNVSPVKICEIILNTLNHVMIGIASTYMTWVCLVQIIIFWQFSLHVLFTTLGYQLLMAESILVYYSNNSWSNLFRRSTKNHLHWVTQVLGSGLALAGILLELDRRSWIWIWNTNHAIYGFVSAILLIINLFIGIGALYAGNMRYIIRPVIIKFVHNFLGLATFIFGMVSLYFGYYTEYIMTIIPREIVELMVACTIITTVLSCMGAFKSLNHQGREVMKLLMLTKKTKKINGHRKNGQSEA